MVPPPFNDWAKNLIDRSHLPDVGLKLTYYITPGAGANVEMLARIKAAVDEAKKEKDFPDDVQVLDSLKAAKEKKLCRIGDHPFQFYATWMKSEHYKLIWEHHPDLPLDYLKRSELKNLREKIGKQKVERQFRRLQWPFDKDNSTDDGFPERSAEDMGNMFIPSVKFEKLHLVAGSFGGRNNRANKIIGTRACNSHMARAECAIATVLIDNLNIDDMKKRKIEGTLEVTNEWNDFKVHDIPRIHDDGIWKGHSRPAWFDDPTRGGHQLVPDEVKHEDYMWLCVYLKYLWKMNDRRGLNLPMNSYVYFDPFSCYTPLRVEALMDIALGKLLEHIPVQPKTAGSTTAHKLLVSLMNDNPKVSTSTQSTIGAGSTANASAPSTSKLPDEVQASTSTQSTIVPEGTANASAPSTLKPPDEVQASTSTQSTIVPDGTANASAPSTLNRQDSDVYSTADEFSDEYSTAPPSPNVENWTQFFESAKPFMKGYP